MRIPGNICLRAQDSLRGKPVSRRLPPAQMLTFRALPVADLYTNFVRLAQGCKVAPEASITHTEQTFASRIAERHRCF